MATAKKLPSGSWRVNQYIGRDKDGKRVYKSFTASTKKQAEFLAAEYVAKHKSPTERMTVGEAIDRYIESKDGVLSPTTISGYQNIRRYHLGGIMDTQLDRLTREDVQREVNAEAKLHSAKTVANAHGLLAAALAVYMPDFVLRTTLPRKVKPLRRELPTASDVMAAIKGNPAELPVLLALCLCLRMSEVRGIRKSAVEGDLLRIDRVIVPVRGKDIEKELAKTDATRRFVQLPPHLKQMITNCETEYITTLSARAIYGRFTNAMRKAGFEGIRFHDLRHIAASDMHAHGIPDRVAAERGGWAGVQTMQQVYQHTFAADREQAERTMISYYESLLSGQDATQNATQSHENQADT